MLRCWKIIKKNSFTCIAIAVIDRPIVRNSTYKHFAIKIVQKLGNVHGYGGEGEKIQLRLALCVFTKKKYLVENMMKKYIKHLIPIM